MRAVSMGWEPCVQGGQVVEVHFRACEHNRDGNQKRYLVPSSVAELGYDQRRNIGPEGVKWGKRHKSIFAS